MGHRRLKEAISSTAWRIWNSNNPDIFKEIAPRSALSLQWY
jgi:hypothetical protein